MNILTGKAVPPGGTIGVVSSASPYSKYYDVYKGIAWWEAHGYHVKLAEGALERTDYFIGFSDITALHCALFRSTGLATFYGPSLTSVVDG